MRFQKTAALKPFARSLCSLFVAGAVLLIISVSTSTAEVAGVGQYDWQGWWELSYTSQIKGPSFPWEFTNNKDAFHASFGFSVDASGNVKGEAHSEVSLWYDYDGCASEPASKHVCLLRCKGLGKAGAPRFYKADTVPRAITPDVWPLPGEAVTLSITGQVNGGTVHLKLNPPADLVAFNVSSTCVGEVGTQQISQKMSWFCGAGSQVCAASTHFFEIDLPLVSKAHKLIQYPEAGGGEDGWVSIRRTCRNIRDGDDGLVYVKDRTTSLHQEPSVNSPIVGGAPRGGRFVFRNTMQKNGMRWYYVTLPGGTPGWVPSSELSCDRPPPLAPGKKLRLKDTGLENSHPTASMTSASNG
jgi:hypothetical protein